MIAQYLRNCCAATVLVVLPVYAAPPNIVLILADDLGYTDIGSYGSEIRTPTLDALAERGIRFSNYHTAASCAPTRAMILTGIDNHLAGVANIPEAIPPEQSDHPNYQGVLSPHVETVASKLLASGYHTYLSGKWHLGHQPEQRPSARGFERTVAMADTGSDNWQQKPYIPIYDQANWYKDGAELTLPDNYYSSEFLVDEMIGFIESNAGDGKPFFAYLPFLAVHIPVQAPREYTEKYLETYQEGWHALREMRHQRAVELGLVAPAARVEMASTADWDSMSREDQRYHAKRMAVYAGMVEAMDFHIGRLVQHLMENGQLDNTVFIFTSDNGAEASGSADQAGLLSSFFLWLRDYSVDYETLGERGSFNAISPSFASASVGPLAFYKFYAGEGGMRVPLIITGRPVETSGSLTDTFAYVTDIAATVLDIGQVPIDRKAMTGRSLLPALAATSDPIYTETDVIGYEVGGNAALYQGDYKVVKNRVPMGDGDWHLYDLKTDPGETTDLADLEPARFKKMLAHYAKYAQDNGVLAVPDDYSLGAQIALNAINSRVNVPLVVTVLSALLLLLVWFFCRRRGPSF